MKLWHLVIFVPLFWMIAENSQGITYSELRLDDEVSESYLSNLAGGPVAIQRDEIGKILVSLPDKVVRELARDNIRFEVLQSFTILSDTPMDKATQSISHYDSVGFPINFANYGSVTITGAPANAVVSSVTVRVRGISAYADLCWFQLRDSADTRFTFPKWFDEIWFDHTVTGISVFNGRPVNQQWRLWGQGSNTAGERVSEWWITIYYQSTTPPGEGEGEMEDSVNWTHGCPSSFFIEPANPSSMDKISFVLPTALSGNWQNSFNQCFAEQYAGRPTLSIDYTNQIVNIYFVPVPLSVCILIVNPVDCITGLIGPLPPGNWRFVSNSRITNINFPFVVNAYSGEGENEAPSVRIIGRAWVEWGGSVMLRAHIQSLTGDLEYRWNKDGVFIEGAITPDFHIPLVTTEDAGAYVLYVEDESKTIFESPPFIVTVYPENSLDGLTILSLCALCLIITALYILYDRFHCTNECPRR